jgi:hypothetical protein
MHSKWEDKALLERGWVLQERYLSPRILSFKRFELSWKCRDKYTCECGGSGDDWTTPESWDHIVMDYSKLQLTNPKDKLTAISGIAQAFKAKYTFQGAYYAGLWRKCLLSQLTWYTMSGDQQVEGLAAYRAPSWSWASIDAVIDFDLPDVQRFFSTAICFKAKILKVHCEISNNNPYGEVFDAYMDLRTATFPAQRLCKDSLHTSNGESTFYLTLAPRHPLVLDDPKFDYLDNIIHINKMDEMRNSTTNFHCTVLRIGKLPESPQGKVYIQFLILAPMCLRRNEWKRVGFVAQDFGPEEVDDFIKLCYSSVTSLRIV